MSIDYEQYKIENVKKEFGIITAKFDGPKELMHDPVNLVNWYSKKFGTPDSKHDFVYIRCEDCPRKVWFAYKNLSRSSTDVQAKRNGYFYVFDAETKDLICGGHGLCVFNEGNQQRRPKNYTKLTIQISYREYFDFIYNGTWTVFSPVSFNERNYLDAFGFNGTVLCIKQDTPSGLQILEFYCDQYNALILDGPHSVDNGKNHQDICPIKNLETGSYDGLYHRIPKRVSKIQPVENILLVNRDVYVGDSVVYRGEQKLYEGVKRAYYGGHEIYFVEFNDGKVIPFGQGNHFDSGVYNGGDGEPVSKFAVFFFGGFNYVVIETKDCKIYTYKFEIPKLTITDLTALDMATLPEEVMIGFDNCKILLDDTYDFHAFNKDGKFYMIGPDGKPFEFVDAVDDGDFDDYEVYILGTDKNFHTINDKGID